MVLFSVTVPPTRTPSLSASVVPIMPCALSSLGQAPLIFHHERMPFMPATVDSPESMCRVLANQVPTTGTFAALQESVAEPEQSMSAWMLSSGAKFVMLNAQKIVLILDASDSLRKVVESVSSDCVESPVLYRSFTTASALGCTTMFEP